MTSLNRTTRVLPWEQAPLRELLRLSWPIAISTLSYSVMSLVDTLFVSHLGAAELAGVGLGTTGGFIMLCFAFGMLRGVKVLVSQAVGAGERGELGRYLGGGLIVAALLSAITIPVSELVAYILPWIASTPASGDAAREYLSIRALGTPMALFFVAVRESRYGLGESRWAMASTIVANVTNIVLNYLFIFHLEMGVAGSAWATVIAHGVEALMMGLVQLRDGYRLAGTSMRHVAAIWRIGVPTGVQFLLEFGAFAMLTFMLAALSETEMAGHQIAIQLIHFAFLPAVAIAEAVSVLAGQAVGAHRDALVVRVARYGLAIAGGYAVLCGLVFAFGGRWLSSAFEASEPVMVVTTRLLMVAAAFQLFDAFNIIARGALRGTGDVRFPAWIGILCAWVCTPPLTWLLGYHYGLGAVGGWLGLTLELVIGAVVLWTRLERGGWTYWAARSRDALASEPSDPTPPTTPEAHPWNTAPSAALD